MTLLELARDQGAKIKASLALWWLLATLVGLLAGYFLAVALSYLFGQTLPEAIIFALVFAISGTTQWLVLRIYLQEAWWWVLASAAGWTTGWALVWLIARPANGLPGLVLASLVAGMAQLLVLRRHSPRALWWLFGSLLGWACGWGAAGLLKTTVSALPGQLSWFLVVGMVAGGITGLILALVIRPNFAQIS